VALRRRAIARDWARIFIKRTIWPADLGREYREGRWIAGCACTWRRSSDNDEVRDLQWTIGSDEFYSGECAVRTEGAYPDSNKSYGDGGSSFDDRYRHAIWTAAAHFDEPSTAERVTG